MIHQLLNQTTQKPLGAVHTRARAIFLVWAALAGLSLVGACQAPEGLTGGTGDGISQGKVPAEPKKSGENDKNVSTEPTPAPEQNSCVDRGDCPMHVMDPIAPFENPEGFDFAFPADLSNPNAWANQLLFADSGGYDLSHVDRIKVIRGNWFLVKTAWGDRVLSFSNNGPYWAGSNDLNAAQGDWLTLENARWIDTHTAAVELCVRRVYDCRTIIEIVQ